MKTMQQHVEELLARITTVELLEEVDRRLTETLFDPHREVKSVREELTDQAKFHFLTSVAHVRDATMNYNRARALENDRQSTFDWDKGDLNDRTPRDAA